MKKSVNPMDQLFKNTFESASDPIDQDALWPYVKQNLPAKEPSKGFFLYFLSGLTLLLLVLAAWIWTRDVSSAPQLNEKKAINTAAASVEVEKSSTLPKSDRPAHKSKDAIWASVQKAYHPEDAQWPSNNVTEQKLYLDNFINAQTQNGSRQDSRPRKFSPLLSLPINRLLLTNDLSSISLDGPGDPSWSRCSDKKSLGLGFLIEGFAFGGYPLISNQVNSNTDLDYQNYLGSWNQSETAVSTFSAGLLIGLETKWGGSISTGFEYQQIQNRLNQEQRIVERVTVYDEMAYFFLDSNNNRVYVADSVTTSRTYTRELQTAKTHTLINIPVLLGYHRKIGKFRFGLIGGVNIHLRNTFKGKALNASGQIIDASSDSHSSMYRKDLNMSIIGGIDAGYMIREGLEVYLSPRFRYQGDSWLRSDHPLVSKIQLIGLQAGIRLHL